MYKQAEEIDFAKLPEKFVLKTNHDCGSIFICTDKISFDKENAKQKLNQALQRNYAKKHLEYHYKYIKPCIICEEFLEGENGDTPEDYKIYCFHGKPECIMVCTNRQKNLKLAYYDLEWNQLDYLKPEYMTNQMFSKPKKLNEMLEIAANLSKDFKFVRVDLYCVRDKIYFGELTFTPAAGIGIRQTDEALKYLGSLIKL